MDKKLKNLIYGVIALAVLGGLLIAIKFMPEKDTSESSSTADDTVTLVDIAKTAIKKLDFKNNDKSFSLVKKSEIDASAQGSDLASESGSETGMNSGILEFTIKELGKAPVSETAVSAVIDLVSDFKVTLLTSEAEDFEQFGLKDPYSVVNITLADGTSITLNMGGVNPSGEEYYCRKNDENSVYTVSIYEAGCLYYSLYDFVDTTLISPNRALLEESDEPDIEYIRFDNEKGEEVIKLVKTYAETDDKSITNMGASLTLQLPVRANLDASKITQLTTSLLGLEAEKTIAIDPTESDLKKYGLDKPSAVSIKFGDGTVKMQIGGKFTETIGEGDNAYKETYYPVILEGIPAIFAVNEDFIFVSFNPDDYLSSFAVLSYIGYVSSLYVKVEGVSYSMVLDGSETEGTLTAMINGRDIDIDKFKNYYQTIVAAPSETLYKDELSGDPAATIVYKYNDGSADDTVKIYKTGARTIALQVNENSVFTGPVSYLEKLIQHTKLVAQNEDLP